MFSALIDQVRVKHTELRSTIEGKQREMENVANAMVEHMELEITELQERSSELEKLEDNLDHLHVLQVCTSTCFAPCPTPWISIQNMSLCPTFCTQACFIYGTGTDSVQRSSKTV